MNYKTLREAYEACKRSYILKEHKDNIDNLTINNLDYCGRETFEAWLAKYYPDLDPNDPQVRYDHEDEYEQFLKDNYQLEDDMEDICEEMEEKASRDWAVPRFDESTGKWYKRIEKTKSEEKSMDRKIHRLMYKRTH